MWLDVIEAKTMDAHMDMGPSETPENSWCACYEEDVPRMARVLRELAEEVEYLRAQQKRLDEGTTGFRDVYCTTIVPSKPSLSDDARELIGDE